MVFMGAGRIEDLVSAYDSVNQPIPSVTWRTVLTNVRHRLTVVARKR
jgi:hypothetical protein